MEANIYDQKGKVSGKIDLPKEIFGLSWNADIVHQVVVSMTANARNNTAHTKTRGEVSGGGKKPWQQKGTGRARHGSNRSPIWIGGGTTFGPRNDKDYTKKINKKMRSKALFTVLSKKLKDGEVIFVDNLKLKEPKTKLAAEVISALSKEKTFSYLARNNRKNGLLAVIGEDAKNITKSFRNLESLDICLTKNLNPVDVLNKKYLIITNPTESVEFLTSRAA